MIEFGVTLLLVAIAGYVVAMIEPTRDTLRAVQNLLDGVEQHRRSQGTAVMKHAGFYDTEDA